MVSFFTTIGHKQVLLRRSLRLSVSKFLSTTLRRRSAEAGVLEEAARASPVMARKSRMKCGLVVVAGVEGEGGQRWTLAGQLDGLAQADDRRELLGVAPTMRRKCFSRAS